MPRRIALLIPLLFLIAAPAHALDVGHCDTPEKMSAALKAEGHKIVARMERVGVSLELNRATGKNKVARAATLLTAKPDMTRWYLVRSFAPLGARSDKMCISMAGRNLEINDYRRNGTPTVTAYEFDPDKALAECERLSDKVGNCSDRAEFLQRLESRFAERIAVQGVTDKAGLMTLVADPGHDGREDVSGEQDFRILTTTGTGATAIALGGGKFSFSSWITGVLDQR